MIETALADGTSIPVLMLHGWTGRSAHNDARTGAFSSLIDLTANKVGTASVGRSLIGQMQDAGGTSVYTFDYHDASSRWVTDAAIGPKLADAISCLSAEYGHPVVVMAHSMGGLAIRQALYLLEKSKPNTQASDYVSNVVTFGTPNTGSWVASVVEAGTTASGVVKYLPGTTGAAINAVRSVLVLCGTLTTSSMENTGACGILPVALASASSQAGKALRIGSSEIKGLPAWPDGVVVDALAGSIDLEIARTRWFGLTTKSEGNVNTGDFIVGTGSATDRATHSRAIECFYTLDPAAAAQDNIAAADWLRLKALNDTRDYVITSLGDSACFHGNLMRSIELSNEALGVLVDVVDAANADADIPVELRGDWCPQSAGSSGDNCFSFAEMRAEYPDSTVDFYESDSRIPGVKGIHVCLQLDLGVTCATASSMYLDYLPAGVPWNCEMWAAEAGWPGCDPSFTSAHDESKPRLRINLNHQQGESYGDTEPMYRR
ncbi:esterase/lipase family protein [Conyzicola sp.]|uniref:esterase/lipase family protein n=1 Tax=Conyzicola sp. TaxID=1969404 RepID=UPI003989D7D1